MAAFNAVRSNLTSPADSVDINKDVVVGTGAFRILFAAEYRGGNRNR